MTLKFPMLAAALALTLSGSAFAAETSGEDNAAPGEPIHDSVRTGWTAQVAAGMGDLHTFPQHQSEILNSGNGIAFDVGRSLSQNFLLLASMEMVNAGHTTDAVYGLSGQYFFTQRVWGKLGVGGANFSQNATNTNRWSGGILGGLGIEFLEMKPLALDGQLAWMAADYPHPGQTGIEALNVSLMIGVRWYGL